MPERQQPQGVMDADYAAGRRNREHLRFRLECRALMAVQAYQRHTAPTDRHRVLELGAAEGLTLMRIRDLLGGHGVFDGVEFSESLVAEARELPDNVTLLRGDVMALPAELEPESYDLCTALAVLEHLSDPLRALCEAYRMLRPGGVLVATCPHPLWDDIAGRLGMVEDDAHEQELGQKQLLDLAHRSGFDEAEFEPFMWAPVGTLPYFGVRVPAELSLRIDRWIRHVPFSGFTFVNQALVATKH